MKDKYPNLKTTSLSGPEKTKKAIKSKGKKSS